MKEDNGSRKERKIDTDDGWNRTFYGSPTIGGIEFIKEPIDIPPGRFAIYQDNSGNLIRILDFSKER